MLKNHGYNEVKKVGEGSFGQAILVESEAEKTKLICKVVSLAGASEKESNDAHKECKLLSALRHPYIVRYRDSFMENRRLCILMDYCEGGDLSARIEMVRKQRQSFPEDQVQRWMTQATMALKHMHEKHVLHRDLKTSNFFLAKDDSIRIGDFGIAKVLRNTNACAMTQIGTPYYLSPEVCREKPYSWGSDIWAMGCVLYELCALRVPFDAANLASLVDKICRTRVPPLPHKYSGELQQLLNEMLNRNPDNRPSAGEILQRPMMQNIVRKLLQERQSQESASDSRANQVAVSVEPPSAAEKSRNRHTPSPHGRSIARSPSVPSMRPRRQSFDVAGSPGSPYMDTAGTFNTGNRVEYWSNTHHEWLPATVTVRNQDGSIKIDLKPNSWLSLDEQAAKVRPPRNQPPHSGGAAPSAMPSWRVASPMLAGTPSRKRAPSIGASPVRERTPMRRRVASPSPGREGSLSRGGVASPWKQPALPRVSSSPSLTPKVTESPPKLPAVGSRQGLACRNAGMAIVTGMEL